MAPSRTQPGPTRPKDAISGPAGDPHGLSPALKRWLIALAAMIVLPWIIVGILLRAGDDPEPAPPAVPELLRANPGPWGSLKLLPIDVSPPLEYVSTDPPADEGLWHLPGIAPESVDTFFAVYGLTQDQIASLRAATKPNPRIGGSTVRPDAALVRGLTPAVRARLYAQLARTSLNYDQAQAFRYPGQSVDDWLWGDLISPRTRAKVEPLIYSDGTALYFADLALVRGELDEPELQRLIKVLNRRRTYLLKLSVDGTEAVEAAAEYWGVGGRRTDIRSLLESVGARAPEPIDVVHLLPTLARNQMYRFPRITAADLDREIIANCLWTALNFFNSEPDDRFLNVPHALNVLKNDYYLVHNSYRLGDVVAFLDDAGNIFHAAVYLADNIVFTKNGTTPMAPWAVMTLNDVIEVYKSRAPKPRLIFHRHRSR